MRFLKLSAGILLLILNVLVWIYGLIIDISHGMDIIPAVLILVSGVFLIAGYYNSTPETKPSVTRRWRFILNLFLINYLTLYLIYIVGEFKFSEAINFLDMPGIILPVLLCIFIMGFILAWNYELHAAIFFLLWYGLTLYSQLRYPQLLHRGPYILIGLPILVQGILYIVYHFKIKPKEYSLGRK